MLVTLLSDEKLSSVALPEKIKGQYWINSYNSNGESFKLLEIEGINGEWRVKSNKKACVISSDNGEMIKYKVLNNYDICQVALMLSGKVAYLITEPDTNDRKIFYKFGLREEKDIKIGRDQSNDIIFNSNSASSKHAILSYNNKRWSITDCDSTNGTYVNNNRVYGSMELDYGDVIYITGLKIIVCDGFIAINNPDNCVHVNEHLMYFMKYPDIKEIDEDEIEIDSKDYYYRSPRLKRDIKLKEIKVDSPPASFIRDEMPLIMVLGPSVTMGIASVATASYSIYNAVQNGNIAAAIPSMAMSISMLLGTILWPILSKKYEKKRNRKKEEKRIKKYSEYLKKIEHEASDEVKNETEIIEENYNIASYWADIIKTKSRKLWDRVIGQNDFLNIRVGLGDQDSQIKYLYQERRFTLDDDDLQDRMLQLCEKPPKLKGIPITVSLLDNRVFGIIGERENTYPFVNNMLVQLMAQYSYDEVKFVFLMNEIQEKDFMFARRLPHVWSDEKDIRFIATDGLEIKEISNYIERVIEQRADIKKEDMADFTPYYIVFCFDKSLADKSEMLKKVLKKKDNVNISVVSIYEQMKDLPKECSKFVELTGAKGKIYDRNDITGTRLEIEPEYYKSDDLDLLADILSDTELDLTNSSYNLPKMITFLEMYGVGKIEHLNADVRWRENNPVKSLETPIGVDTMGNLFKLDLHEKFHGPHGLVAGMTGSGKSEFIMAFILSMAVNYHPEEVAFVLIDYKGGGMAKAFERLPHTAGIITNLDGAAVNRSLVSIQSELKRRQAVFSEASKLVSESNIDIYKYQQLYREGKVSEPLQHLFIISDEFAELKTQQPDFMEQLVSAARIGRSLGVHLILATQKPAGVVDDQIWSNSKFRICLKVQDRADSMDMLKRPDAASLSDTGRFYLQVGYNELFELGQSAWAGAPYIPSDKVERKRDTSVELMDRCGNVIASDKLEKNKFVGASKKQLDEITNYLAGLAKEENIKIRPLWLEPIPDKIYVENLRTKYNYSENAFHLNPIIGEYDDPARQRQCLLTLPLFSEGNALVYGTAGNGKTTFLTTVLYSMISSHSPDELNCYILDFSSETLRAFSKAPHIGDVMVSGDDEKIENMFKYINNEINNRKQICAEYGGDYQSYISRGNTDMPCIVVLINNYSGFAEIYEDYEEYVQYQSREGIKYGIYFIITALSTNAIRYRLQQNFNQMFVLQMNDSGEYSSVLGSTGGMVPSKMKGRGLFKADSIYEFQTAYAMETAVGSFDSIREYCSALLDYYGERKKGIKVLPEHVTIHDFDMESISMTNVPIGLSKDDNESVFMDFKTPTVSIITGEESHENEKHLKGILSVIKTIPDTDIKVIDGTCNLDEYEIPCELIQDDFEDEIINIYNEVLYRNNSYKDAKKSNIQPEDYVNKIIVFNGFMDVREQLSDDAVDKIKIVLDKNAPEYNFTFIMCDDINNAKKYSREVWFKHYINGNKGVYVGNGITGQYVLNVLSNDQSLKQSIDREFGYLVRDGGVKLCKLIVSDAEE